MSLEKPRFRRDLEARPVTADGQSCVEVWDAAAGKSFVFYDFEYQVALAFDGLPLEKVIPWVKLATGLSLQVDQLRAFAQRLDELGFLERELTQEIKTLDAETPAEPAAPLADAAPSPAPERATETPEPEPPPSPDDVNGAEEQLVPVAQIDAEGKLGSGPAEAAPPSEPPPSKPVPGEDEPPREETPGPPPPDEVVMRPGEVVGETPPPVTLPIASPPESQGEPLPSGPLPATETVGAPSDDVASGNAAASESSLSEPAPAAASSPPTEPAAEVEVVPLPASVETAAVESPEPTPEAAPASESAAGAAAAEGAPSPTNDSAGAQRGNAEESAGVLGDESETPAGAAPSEAPPPDSNPAEAADSTAFPVLPVNRSTPGETAAPSAPPAWTTPRPLTTPRPVTLGPLVDRPSVRRRTRRSLALFGTLGVLAAAALLAVVLPFVFSARQPRLVQVHTQTVALGTVYRYFEGGAPIAPVPGPVLKFPAAGKVIRVAAKGTALAPGDVVAAVEAARGLLAQLAYQRERLAYYQQMAEAMHQVGNSKDEERQLAAVETRRAAIAKTLRELAAVAVVAVSSGEVEESLVREGDVVESGSSAVRLRSPGFRATLELPRAHAAVARRLGFCQVEVEGYLLDCTLAPAAGDDTHVAIDLASVPPTLVGKLAHLARARYSSATVFPVAALQTVGSHVGVFVVPGNARLELRPVVVADRDDAQAIVVQGLDGGEKVVVEPATGLRPGMQVASASRK